MANGWNTESDREAMLRRVAIVLTSLPAPVVSKLMGAVDEDSRRAVRRTMTTLSDVDPLERKRALQAFRVSVQQQPGWKPPTAAAADASANQSAHAASATEPVSHVGPSGLGDHGSAGEGASASVAGGSGSSFDRMAQGESSPLSFLGDVDDETLIRLLVVEHPQAVALVLASIAPAQAARILPLLDSQLRNETLSRLGRLGEVPAAASAEVAEHFRDRLANLGRESNSGGRRALDAILAAMPTPLNISLPGEEDSSDQDDSAGGNLKPQAASSLLSPLSFPSSDVPAMDLAHKLRAAGQGGLEPAFDRSEEKTPTAATHAGQLASPNSTRAAATDQQATDDAEPRALHVDRALTDSLDLSDASDPSILHSTDAIHELLTQLTAEQLCQALGKVATRDAMLALCGLPNEVTESALAVLPRASAKKVRSSMNALGSLQLREIDDAKERVARAAVAIRDQAAKQLPLAA